jgi:porphobilinogen synthase
MSFSKTYPSARPRRLRQAGWIRDLVQEHRLHPSDLIWPLFLVEGHGVRQPITALPGVERLSVDLAVEAAHKAVALGIPMLALFPCTEESLKTEDGREAYNPDSLACKAIKAIKTACPSLGLMADVALDLYTTHGHDGLFDGEKVLNDATVAVLVKQALLYAETGLDALGPSDMMDGRVGAIRQALEATGHHDTQLFSYAAKYDSALYGPYRSAVGSASLLGKRPKSTYQQHPANIEEALHEAALDLQEGADVLIVKPGSFYLDVMAAIKRQFQVPVVAYQVSGEYAMLQAAAQNGWLDGERATLESLLCFKRAGCSAVITYAAPVVAEQLSKLS